MNHQGMWVDVTRLVYDGVDEEAEPDEWVPIVQSYIAVAAGSRGGKRKR